MHVYIVGGVLGVLHTSMTYIMQVHVYTYLISAGRHRRGEGGLPQHEALCGLVQEGGSEGEGAQCRPLGGLGTPFFLRPLFVISRVLAVGWTLRER